MKLNGNRFRRKRFMTFLSILPQDKSQVVRILDVGGTPEYWDGLKDLWQDRNLHFTIVNLDAPSGTEGMYDIRSGNACDLREYSDNAFDLVHSNSVIEHVGHWAEMTAMAREIRRLAPVYYLQTPYFWFPIEPHYRAAFFHWLPESTQAAILAKHRLGFRGPTHSFDLAMRDIQTVNLLTRRQLQALFPDGQIVSERLLGLTKSVIVVRK